MFRVLAAYDIFKLDSHCGCSHDVLVVRAINVCFYSNLSTYTGSHTSFWLGQGLFLSSGTLRLAVKTNQQIQHDLSMGLYGLGMQLTIQLHLVLTLSLDSQSGRRFIVCI